MYTPRHILKTQTQKTLSGHFEVSVSVFYKEIYPIFLWETMRPTPRNQPERRDDIIVTPSAFSSCQILQLRKTKLYQNKNKSPWNITPQYFNTA